MISVLRVIIFLLIFGSPSFAATYYLDATAADDSGAGGITTPWKTLTKAQSVAVAGDTVLIMSGEYGLYDEANVARSGAVVTYRAVPGQAVNLTGISIINTSPTQTGLVFDGIRIKPPWVDPCSTSQTGCSDPQYANSTLSTYAKTTNAVNLNNTGKVKIIDCTIEGQSKHLTEYGVVISGGNDVTVEHCEITKVQRGVMMDATSNINLINNHIHNIGASAILHGGTGCINTLIENNHLHNSKYSTTDDYAPRADGQNYHGSGITLRTGTATVRGNIIHDGFPSYGIGSYGDDSTGINHFDNSTIENNLIYDVASVYVLRIYKLGDNVVVRNNTVIGTWRVGGGEYRYNTAFSVASVDSDGTPHLDLNNNLFIGAAYYNDSYTTQNNNMFYSVAPNGGAFLCGMPNESTVMACTYSSDASTFMATLFTCGADCDYVYGSAADIDYSLSSDSPAKNAGNYLYQPNTSLGVIVDGYVALPGATRGVGAHSAGAYEYGSIPQTTKHLRLSTGCLRRTDGSCWEG